jgi:hypothetical protein
MTTHKCNFIIDQPIPEASRAQFASVIAALQPEVVEVLRAHFHFDQSEQFYLGLCSGLASAHQIVEGMPARQVLGLLASLLAVAATQVAVVDEFPETELEERDEL